MKKFYILAIALVAFTFVNAQVWNFGTDEINFPINGGIGAGPDNSVTINGLGIHTGTIDKTNMGAVDSNKKSFTSAINSESYSFTKRFKFNGAGYSGAKDSDTEPSTMTPTQRYLTINVTEDTDIYVIGAVGGGSNPRTLFITDGTKVVGTLVTPTGGALTEAVIEYKGGASTLYLFCNEPVNLFYLSATSLGTSTKIQNIENSAVVSSQYYNLSGVNVGSDFNSLSNGVYIKVDTLENGSKSSSKVVKN